MNLKEWSKRLSISESKLAEINEVLQAGSPALTKREKKILQQVSLPYLEAIVEGLRSVHGQDPFTISVPIGTLCLVNDKEHRTRKLIKVPYWNIRRSSELFYVFNYKDFIVKVHRTKCIKELI